MASQDEIFQAIRNADAAGDGESVKKLAAHLETMKQGASPEGNAPSAQTGPATLRQKVQASLPMRVVQGMRDPVDGAAQLLPRGLEMISSGFGLAPNPVSEWFGSEAKRVDQMTNDNEREYQQSRTATTPHDLSSLVTGQKDPGFDGARFAGNVISPANAVIATRLPVAATTGARVLQGVGLGAAGGALTPVDTSAGQDFASTKTSQIGLGAATGGVVTPLLGKLGDVVAARVQQWANKPNAASIQQTIEAVAKDLRLNWEQMTAAERKTLTDQVMTAAQKYKGKDPAAATRASDFEAEGMPYLTGQVTRDPAQFAREKNLSQLPGTGDPITQRLQQQGQMMREKIGRYGSNVGDEQSGGDMLVRALREFDSKKSGEVNAAYQAARNSAGKDAELPLQGLSQDVADVIDRFGDKVPSGVITQFKKYGILPDQTSSAQRKLFTVEEADRLLKVINDNVGADAATNKALTALRAAVKTSVTVEGKADDVFAPARAAAAQRFSLHDAVPALEASASGAANPDTFVQKFIVSKTAQSKQVQEMARLLREGSPEAFDQAKAQVGSYLQRKAFGENAAGDKQFSAERYAKALRELGPEKLGAFFNEAEVSQLSRLGRIGAYVDSVPNASRPNTSGNWGAITQLGSKLPGVPTSIALANALKNGVSNQLGVRDALSGNLPPKLTAEQIGLMAKILSQSGLASGAAVAGQLR